MSERPAPRPQTVTHQNPTAELDRPIRRKPSKQTEISPIVTSLTDILKLKSKPK